jgi:hypothetical protein
MRSLQAIAGAVLFVASVSGAAQTPALDKAKEDKAVAEAQEAAAKASKAAYEAQAAAAEAKAKADLAQAKAEVDLAKAIADQQKAVSDASVAAQTTGAQIDLKTAEALTKQGEAYSKLFPVFDTSKIRAPTPGQTEFKSQQLAISQSDAQCMAAEVAKKILSDLGKACAGSTEALMVLDAPAQRTAIRAYNLAEAQTAQITRRIDGALAQTAPPPAGGIAGLAALPALGALVQFGGSLASLVSAVKSVYANANATSTTFDEALRAEVLNALRQPATAGGMRVQVLDPKVTWPSIGVARTPGGTGIIVTGLLKDLGLMQQKQALAAQRAATKKQDLSNLVASGQTTNSPRKARLESEIALLEGVVKEASEFSTFLLKDDARLGNQAPLNLIMDVQALASSLSGGQCQASLDLATGTHMVDTRAQDSALQLRQHIYLASAGQVTWRVWDTSTGKLLSAGSEGRRRSWTRSDEAKNEIQAEADCS